MTIYNASTNADQKFTAPPNNHCFEKVVDSENILQKKISNKKVLAPNTEKLQIVGNACCQSFTPIRALFEG